MKRTLSFCFCLAFVLIFAIGLVSCGGVEFKVDFVVDGQVYSTVNTGGGEVIKMPNDPEKEGFKFEGWYWDEGEWQRPFTANSLLDTPLSSNMCVYAKWMHNHVSSDWIIDKAATCTAEGARHKECTECKTVLESEVISKADHTPVIDAAVPATETKNGLTEGSHCSACGTVIVAQQVVPATLKGVDICSNTMTLEGSVLSVSVSNDTEIFSFLEDIVVSSKATYVVATNVACTDKIDSKTGELEIGDNRFYILVTNGRDMKLYTVNVRRRPMYTVSFNANGGTAVHSQTVEEGSLATEPITTRAGYTFIGWEYDFATSIVADTVIKAKWTVNTDTAYKIEYYYENLTKTGYDAPQTVSKTGTTDTNVSVTPETVTGFTFNTTKSKLSGNLNGDGSQVLKVYYTRNEYTVSTSASNSKVGTVSGAGRYPYGTTVIVTATAKAGYTVNGWFVGTSEKTKNTSYSFNVEGDISLTANITVNTDTAYKIEYYYENLTKTGYDDPQIVSKTGTTDTNVSVTPETVEHFTLNTTKSKLSGNLNGDGSQVLKVYYTRNEYTVSVTGEGGTVIGGGTYPFGTEISLNPNANLGYKFKGWYVDGELVSEADEYSCEISGNIVAKYELTSEMANFKFTSTATTCSITGINDKTVKEITVPDYVTSISAGAFSGCSSLESITLPFVGGSRKSASDTYQYPFGYIFGTSGYTGGVSTYQYYYGSSTSITTSTTYYIPASLKSVKITGGNILRGAFYNCTSLTSVEIGDSVTSIGELAFHDCDSLTSVIIPDSVTSIGDGAFRDCDSLTSVEIGDSVTSIGDGAFHDCDSLTSVEIGDSVESIGNNAFYSCDSLTSVEIGDSVTSIGDYAFAWCDSLTSVYITDIESWCKIQFSGYSSNPLYYANNLYLNGSLLTELVIPDSVESIGSYAFYNCDSLTSVIIPDSVTSIGEDAFYWCDNLTSVYITDIESWCKIQFSGYLSNPLSYADNLYLNGSLLTELVIPDSVTSIGSYAFYGCDSLKSVEIGDSVTSIGEKAFAYCSSLTSITVSEGNPTYKSLDGNLYTKDGKTLIQYAIGKTDTNFVIPDSVTSIGDYAFSWCYSLTSVEIPDSVTSIGDRAFHNCDSLTSVEIPDNVTSIGSYAFCNCSRLTSVEIPDSVTSIGSFAFYWCDNLTSVTFKNTTGWWYSSSSTATSGTSISSSDLANKSTAAEYLTDTYGYYYWKRG